MDYDHLGHHTQCCDNIFHVSCKFIRFSLALLCNVLYLSTTFFAGQQYCWSDTASCISETASTTILPNHLRSTDITSSKTRPTSGNLETASAVVSASAVGRKSYNNLKTTHYGLIDWPSPKAVLATSNEKREVFLKNWINRLGSLYLHIESTHFMLLKESFFTNN